MAAEAGVVHGGLRVHIHPALEQPLRDLQLVEIDTQVEQRCALERCAVHGPTVMTAYVAKVDLIVNEGPPQESRVAAQMLLK